MKFKAIVFDRDGTLNHCTSHGLYYVTHPEQLVLFDGVKETLAWLREQKVLPFVFTQQNGISNPEWPDMTEAALQAVHSQFQELLGEKAHVEAFYHASSPTHPLAKPGAGMLQALMKDYRLNPDEVLVVGDSARDYEAAKAAGLAFVLMQWEGEKPVTLESKIPTFKNFSELKKFLSL